MRHAIQSFAMTGLALAALAGLGNAPAAGQTVTRVFTQLDSEKCRHTKGRGVEDYGSWRWIFFMNLPVGLINLALAAIFLKESPRKTGQKPLFQHCQGGQ